MLDSVHVDMIVGFVLLGGVQAEKGVLTGVFVVRALSAELYIATAGNLDKEELFFGGMYI